MKNTFKLTSLLALTLLLITFSCSSDDEATTIQTNPGPTALELLKAEADVALLFNGDAEDEKLNLTFTGIEGATLTTDRKGNNNQAYFFDGIDDYISYSGIDAIADNETFTISVWAKNDEFPDVDEFQFLFSSEQLFQLGINNNDNNGTLNRRITYALNNTNPDWFSQYVDLNEDVNTFNAEWQHYIIQYNNGVIKLYINTIEKASFMGSGEVDSNLNLALLIGAKPEGSNVIAHFKGAIDDFILFNKVLTETEIALLSNDR